MLVGLLVVEEVLVEHGVVVVLIVVLDKLFLLKRLSIVPDLLDILTYLHAKSISLLYIRVLLLKDGPKLYYIASSIFKQPVQLLPHLVRLDERCIINLILGVPPEFVQYHLK